MMIQEEKSLCLHLTQIVLSVTHRPIRQCSSGLTHTTYSGSSYSTSVAQSSYSATTFCHASFTCWNVSVTSSMICVCSCTPCSSAWAGQGWTRSNTTHSRRRSSGG